MIKPRKGTKLYQSLGGNRGAIYFIYKGSVYYQSTAAHNYKINASSYGGALSRFKRDTKKLNEFRKVKSLVKVNLNYE